MKESERSAGECRIVKDVGQDEQQGNGEGKAVYWISLSLGLVRQRRGTTLTSICARCLGYCISAHRALACEVLVAGVAQTALVCATCETSFPADGRNLVFSAAATVQEAPSLGFCGAYLG